MNHSELVAFLRSAKETADDNTALVGMDLYPHFDSIKGTYQKKGTRCRYEVNGIMALFKLTCEDQTAEGTLIVENWTPTSAASIWTAIDVTHAGTLEDPIPAVAGMEYEYGKYYIEDGTIYLMNRAGMSEGETVTLHYLPSQLIGQYFEVVTA